MFRKNFCSLRLRRPNNSLTRHRHFQNFDLEVIIIIIIIIISTTMFMVLSSWQSHCDSSPGSFDECRMALDLCPLHSQILDPPLTWAAECVIRRMSNVLIYDCLRPGFHKMQDTHATQWSCVKSLRTQRNVTHARLVLAYNGQFGTLRGLRCVILIILRNVTHARSQIGPTQRKR